MQLAEEAAIRWVARYMAAYCYPGAHQYAQASEAIRWCTACYKEESAAGTTCLICDAPGELAGDLMDGGITLTRGMVCADCDRGLGAMAGEGNAVWAFLPARVEASPRTSSTWRP